MFFRSFIPVRCAMPRDDIMAPQISQKYFVT